MNNSLPRAGQPDTNFWISCQIFKIIIREQPGHVSLEHSPILHINTKYFFDVFNIHWIFQEWNYHVNWGETVLCFVWNFNRRYSSFQKTTSSLVTLLVTFVCLWWSGSGMLHAGCKQLTTSSCLLAQSCLSTYIGKHTLLRSYFPCISSL